MPDHAPSDIKDVLLWPVIPLVAFASDVTQCMIMTGKARQKADEL